MISLTILLIAIGAALIAYCQHRHDLERRPGYLQVTPGRHRLGIDKEENR